MPPGTWTTSRATSCCTGCGSRRCRSSLAHWALRQSAPHLIRLQGPPLRAVVVGMNEQGGSLADRLAMAHYTGVELLGFFDDRTPDRIHGRGRHRMLGRIQEIADYVKTHRVHLVYLSLPMASQPRIKQLLDALKDTTASVYFVPDMFVTDLIQGRTDTICGLPVISVCETPFRGPNAAAQAWQRHRAGCCDPATDLAADAGHRRGRQADLAGAGDLPPAPLRRCGGRRSWSTSSAR